MNTLLALLFLASFLSLVIGLIKPDLFTKIIKSPTRKKVAVRLGAICLALFFIIGLAAKLKEDSAPLQQFQQVDQTKKIDSVPPKQTTIDPLNITVTSQIVKKVDGKYRYFFDIRNNDTKDFQGSVIIQLITKQGTKLSSETFNTNKAISPSLGTSVYVDANTGPVRIHDEYGYEKFTYEIKVEGKTLKTGDGIITDKYENLSK